MTLDSEFKKQTEKLVSETLQLYKNAGASPRISDVWKCENTGTSCPRFRFMIFNFGFEI